MLVMIDLDNTLADRERAVSDWAGEFCAEHGLPPYAQQWIVELDNDGYSNRRDVFGTIKHRFELVATVEVLVADYRRHVIALTQLTAGAEQCLQSLRAQGHQIAVVTNGSSESQHAKMDALGLRPLVDALIVSGDLGVEKPDRVIFEAAAEATDTSLDDAWMVGDSPHHDIGGAVRLGLRSAWIRRGRRWVADGYRPTVQLDSLVDLASAVSLHL